MIGAIHRGKSFSSTLRYVLGEKKKPVVVFANLAEAYSPSIEPLVKAFSNHAALHNQTKSPVYHLSVSPAINDSVSARNWHELSRSILKSLNLENHQAIAVLHQDTYFPDSNCLRPHIHIVANAVGDNGKCANFFLRLLQT